MEIKSAAALWEKNVKETTSLLKAKGSGSVACIGRAGEKQVLLAAIFRNAVFNEDNELDEKIRNKGISPAELLRFTRIIGEKEGIGEQLGWGAKLFSASEGCPEKSIQVKGLELPAYDPRGVKGLGFSYATSNRGGCHTRAYLVAPEILRKPKAIDPYTLAGKAGHTIVCVAGLKTVCQQNAH